MWHAIQCQHRHLSRPFMAGIFGPRRNVKLLFPWVAKYLFRYKTQNTAMGVTWMSVTTVSVSFWYLIIMQLTISHVTHHVVSCTASWKLNIEFLLTTHLTTSNTVWPNPPYFPFMCITQNKMALPVFYMHACTVYCTLSGVTIWRVKYSLL